MPSALLVVVRRPDTSGKGVWTYGGRKRAAEEEAGEEEAVIAIRDS